MKPAQTSISPALRLLAALVATITPGCLFPTDDPGPPVEIPYIGSSTVARFLREADAEYARVSFIYDTAPESAGGERAMRNPETRLAGTASEPARETLQNGVVATLIGRDAIAAIVHESNPVTDLTLDQLRAVYAGEVTSWNELGGNDHPIEVLVVGEESATRRTFRRALGNVDDSGHREVRPDDKIVTEVAANPGAIGQISFSFITADSGVRACTIDGQLPTVTNFDYPIARPLHLLWRAGDPEVAAFVRWATSEEGQRVVMRSFVGTRVVGSVSFEESRGGTGTLMVETETFPSYDGGIFYYPHLPYTVLTRGGEVIQRVRNHRGRNDENPARVRLPPGEYLIRTERSSGVPIEFFVLIEVGRITTVCIDDLTAEPPA